MAVSAIAAVSPQEIPHFKSGVDIVLGRASFSRLPRCRNNRLLTREGTIEPGRSDGSREADRGDRFPLDIFLG